MVIAVGSYEILSGRKSVSIPFEMFRGDIRMKARINGRDCHFLVDNGSLWDELLFFGSQGGLGLMITKAESVAEVVASATRMLSGIKEALETDIESSNEE